MPVMVRRRQALHEEKWGRKERKSALGPTFPGFWNTLYDVCPWLCAVYSLPWPWRRWLLFCLHACFWGLAFSAFWALTEASQQLTWPKKHRNPFLNQEGLSWLWGWDIICWSSLSLSRWYKEREVGRERVTALKSHGPLKLVGEQSLPLWLRGAGRNTDSWFFGQLQATCDAWLWQHRGPPHRGVSGYRETQNWVFHGGAKWDFGFGSLE